MFGLDEAVAGMSDGTTMLLVVVVAALLGLRHATDPDHVAAVTTLMAGSGDGNARRGRALGLAWGSGHAVTLFLFGLPIVLWGRFLPEGAQQLAELAVGVLIIALAAWLLVRWRRGDFHVHRHEHEGTEHVHAHSHAATAAHAHPHPQGRSRRQAFGIGLLHGIGGSAGVGILIVAAVESQTLAVAALAILAGFTALSMMLLTSGFGLALGRVSTDRAWNRLAPALGVTSLAFGVWYAAGALGWAPYLF
jgi:ABC-type nickel/cobalt efflux system permease component RcnA